MNDELKDNLFLIHHSSLRIPHLEKFPNHLDDVTLLLGRQLWVDRQGERLARGPLCLREVAFRVTEVGEAGLQVERHGIVDVRADAAPLEVLCERVAPAIADA